MSLRSIGAMCLLMLGCAAEGGREGGADNLPDRGITGWERTETDGDAPFAITAASGILGGASALAFDGRLFVYGHVTSGETTEIMRAEALPDGTFSALESIGQFGTHPSIVLAHGTFWLVLIDPTGAIAIATSADGVRFEGRAVSGVAADRRAPSLVVEGARVRLYLSTGTTLVHSEATADALAFGPETEVLAPGVGCVDPAGEPEACWDEDALVDAEVRLAKTGAGGKVYRMFYAGHAGGDSDIGFAASHDGLVFERFPFNPVLTGTFDELSPSSALSDERYFLFWEEARTTTNAGIARAVHEPTAVSDRW